MGGVVPLAAQTDLDAFMKRVVSRRDDNWQKLQQYILDESEVSEVRGPGGALVWGQRSEYTWFLRDGMFVRSPLEANGVAIGEADRRKSEDDYVRRERRRAERAAADAAARSAEGKPRSADSSTRPDPAGQVSTALRILPQATGCSCWPARAVRPASSRPHTSWSSSSTKGATRLSAARCSKTAKCSASSTYPTSLFRESDERRERQRERRGSSSKADARSDEVGREIQRLMNKTSLVTLWIDPKSEQILKYVFDNVNMEFLPGQWLMQVDDIEASMSMGQPFPDVWLPRHLSLDMAVTSAAGRFDFRYTLDYHDYRQADVKSKVGFPDAR